MISMQLWAWLGLPLVSGFVPASTQWNQVSLTHSEGRIFSTTKDVTEESEVERLLRKARELRAAAESAEQQVHGDLTKKKANKDVSTDKLIDELFFSDQALVTSLRQKRLSMSTLESIITRLDEREVIAQGMDHVKFTVDGGGKVEFHRVGNTRDDGEVERLEGLIDQLVEAVSVLDQEFRDKKKARGQSHAAHAEEIHFCGGHCADELHKLISEIRRERSEQFQKRMEEFREAQRINPDHKFEGYTDLGNLN